MRRFPGRSVALPCLLCLAPLPCLAQSKLGSEFQVNTYTTGAQRNPSVSLDADGDFVVTWRSADQDGSGDGVFARRFNAAGAAQAAEFQVSLYTLSGQSVPKVSLDADGDFVVAWSSSGQDGSDQGVFARRFNAAGIAQGLEFQVNAYTTGLQYNPSVSLDTSGDFVVAWSSNGQDGSGYGVFARRFAAAGIAQAVEFQVNSYTPGAQYLGSVSLDADGDFVVVWRSSGQDGLGYGIFARRFDAAGPALAAEFQVNTYTTGTQHFPSVSLDADGDFVVAWESNQDGSNSGVFARRFDDAGAALAVEFQVNTYTTSSQSLASLSLDADGDFVVAWGSSGQDGLTTGVFARHFDSAGVALATEFRVNSYTPGSQSTSSLSVDAAGRFVVGWESFDQDGSSDGVMAQRFAPPLAILDIDGSGQTAPLSDGLLVLRFLFGFTGAPLVSGAIDLAGCTRCNAPAIEAYLETLI
jgi:hypothetical protein